MITASNSQATKISPAKARIQSMASAARAAGREIKRRLYMPVERAKMDKKTREELNFYTRGRADNFVLVCAGLYKEHVLDTLVEIAKTAAELQERGPVIGRGGLTVNEVLSKRFSVGVGKFMDSILESDGEHYALYEQYAQSPHTTVHWSEVIAFPEIIEGKAEGLLEYIANKRTNSRGNEYYTLKQWFVNLCKDNVNDPEWMGGFEMCAKVQAEYRSAKSTKNEFEGKKLE